VREDLNDTVPGTGGNESLEGRTGDDIVYAYASAGNGGAGENVIRLAA